MVLFPGKIYKTSQGKFVEFCWELSDGRLMCCVPGEHSLQDKFILPAESLSGVVTERDQYQEIMGKIIYEVEYILNHCRDMQGWRFRSIEKSAKRIEDVLIGKEEDDCPRN